jgi:hypothetical protein
VDRGTKGGWSESTAGMGNAGTLGPGRGMAIPHHGRDAL